MNQSKTTPEPWMVPFTAAFALWATLDLLLVHSRSTHLTKNLQDALFVQLQSAPSPEHVAQVSVAFVGTVVSIILGYLLLVENTWLMNRVILKAKRVSDRPIVVLPPHLGRTVALVLTAHLAVKVMVFLHAATPTLMEYNSMGAHFIQLWLCAQAAQILTVDLMLVLVFRYLTRPQTFLVPVHA